MIASKTFTRIHLEKEAHKFSVAHMTVFANGKKERLHGHNYYVSLSVDLLPQGFEDFVDFNVIKNKLRELCQAWDERVLLAERCPYFELRPSAPSEIDFVLCEKHYVLPREEAVLLAIENVTTEGLAGVLAQQLLEQFKVANLIKHFRGFEVGVTETEGQSGYVRMDLSPLMSID